MLALSIRQPYAEEILRGIKTMEYRSMRIGEKRLGERFYIYAAMRRGDGEGIARRVAALGGGWEDLPTGVLVGTAIVERCQEPAGDCVYYQWHLSGVRRLKRPIKPRKHPQPVWFEPF